MKRLFLLLALCGMVAVGCTEGGPDDNINNGGNNTEQPGGENEDENSIFITDSEGNIVVEAEEGEVLITVTTNLEYSVEIPEDAKSWLSVADTRAIRMEKLTFTVAANETFEERSANVELVDNEGKSLQTIKFLQRASDKVFEIDDEGKYTIEADGGVIEVDVTTNLEYSVEIPEDAKSWLSVADTRAVREETLIFTVAENESFDERSATVELKGADGKVLQSVSFKQKGVEEVFDTDSEGKYTIEAVGGVIEVDVTTNLEYSVEIPEDAKSWLSVADTRAIRMENLTFTVAANETFEERSADVELVDNEGKSLQTINFTQLAKSNVMANNEIWYTTTDNKRLIPYTTEGSVFGAYIISNTYSDGKGVLTFDDEITKIGENAFKECTNLASITIPDSVTSIGQYAFSGCINLSSITIGKGVTSIETNAFCGCTGELIVNGNIPNSAFYKSEFTKVTIGNGVTSIGDYAFYGCTSLTSITIPDSVTSIGYVAFCACTSLESVTIPDSVTSIGDMAFHSCTSLESVTIPDSVTSIGDMAFYNCTSLTSVYITDIAAWCNISFSDSPSNPLSNAENLYLNNELATDLIIPDSATKIGDYAFYGCTSLTSITIPDSVTSIGDNAFYNCDSLTSVTIGNGVTSIGEYAFDGCDSLTSVTIGNGVTSIGEYAFYWCNSLTSVTIGNGVTSIGGYAFYACSSLTSVYITDIAAWCRISFGGTDSNPLCYAENLYLNNELVTDLTIPDSVTRIGSYAFYYCDSLTSITIPDSVTSIGDSAFRGCTSLTSVTIPDSVTTIGSYAFYYCDSLTSITIPDSVTSIGNWAFGDCPSLKSVTIGNGVTTIGNSAFRDCDSLKEVYCKPTTPPTGGYTMFHNNAPDRTIYVPSNSVSAYNSASGWSDYASAIVGYDF